MRLVSNSLSSDMLASFDVAPPNNYWYNTYHCYATSMSTVVSYVPLMCLVVSVSAFDVYSCK